MAALADFRSSYTFNSTINGVEAADWLLLIGCNPRHEAPIINARIRKAFLHYSMDIGTLGQECALNYDVTHLGSTLEALTKASPFMDKLKKAEKPMIIVGSGVVEHADAASLLSTIAKVPFCVLCNLVCPETPQFDP